MTSTMDAYETFTKASLTAVNKKSPPAISFDDIIPPEMTDNTQIGETWNGDFNYSSLGEDILSQIL
jgi:hypothetical protein